MEEYLVPSKDAVAEFVERRSRFIGHIWVTDTEQEALERIKAMREKYWDATHNVYAYIIKDGATRYSDDGEPQGTAGMPVLEILRKEGLNNVLCVVTRYFGGILLGAGGLVRAYAKSAKDAVNAAGISVKRVWNRIEIACPYNLYERLTRETAAQEGIVDDTQFGVDVCLTVLLPEKNTQAFLTRVADISGGTVQGSVLGAEYRAFPK